MVTVRVDESRSQREASRVDDELALGGAQFSDGFDAATAYAYVGYDALGACPVEHQRAFDENSGPGRSGRRVVSRASEKQKREAGEQDSPDFASDAHDFITGSIVPASNGGWEKGLYCRPALRRTQSLTESENSGTATSKWQGRPESCYPECPRRNPCHGTHETLYG